MNKHYKYNPFSGVLDEDLAHTLVPRVNIEEIVTLVKNTNPIAIQFIGKKGRGKTTHLIYIQKLLNQYPIFLLNSRSSASVILNCDARAIFIDSIHHLSIENRIKLFKKKCTIIFTTHHSKKFECWLSSKECKSYNFNGIDSAVLEDILNRRLELASLNRKDIDTISSAKVKSLIRKYGDDYRGIINHLYESYS